MSSPIKPLASRVVATRKQAEEKTASGLFLPESSKEKPVLATVVAVGLEVTAVAVGDTIVYKEYTTTELTVDGQEYLIVKEDDVLATV